jgi:AraC family transcriptional regulator
MPDVEIVDLPALRIGVLQGHLMQAVETWQRFGELVDHTNIDAEPGVARAAILPADVIRGQVSGGPDRIPYSAALVAPLGIALPAGLKEDAVPAGRYARMRYVGPYEGLAEAWRQFTQEWLPTSGRAIGPGVCFEVYHDRPGSIPDAQYRTDLHIPIA